MNKNYILIWVVGIVGIVTLLLAFYQNTVGDNFYRLLPQTSSAVLTIPSLMGLFEKMNMEKHGEFLQSLQIQSKISFGWDITNIELLEKNGISIVKPCGIALLDRKMGTIAFFIGVADFDSFWDFLEKRFQQENEGEFQRIRVGDVDCFVDGTLEKPNALHCYYQGYWIIYGMQNLLFREQFFEQFQNDILRNHQGLDQDTIFQKTSGDISVYLSQSTFSEILFTTKIPSTHPIWQWYQYCQSLCVSANWNVQSLSFFIHGKVTESEISESMKQNMIAIIQSLKDYLALVWKDSISFEMTGIEVKEKYYFQQTMILSSQSDILQQILFYIRK